MKIDKKQTYPIYLGILFKMSELIKRSFDEVEENIEDEDEEEVVPTLTTPSEKRPRYDGGKVPTASLAEATVAPSTLTMPISVQMRNLLSKILLLIMSNQYIGAGFDGQSQFALYLATFWMFEDMENPTIAAFHHELCVLFGNSFNSEFYKRVRPEQGIVLVVGAGNRRDEENRDKQVTLFCAKYGISLK